MATEIETRQLTVSELKLGMYVAELDRPWLESPFLFQGFPIRSYDEIDKLRECCDYVFVDFSQSHEWKPEEHDLLARASHEYPHPRYTDGRHRFETRRINIDSIRGKHHYRNSTSFTDELKGAGRVYHKARDYIGSVLKDVRLGHSIDPEGAREMADAMADSIVRNENALAWLTMLKNRDEYTEMHSINVCILSLLFGRHLGLEVKELRLLGYGALLHDIGKMRVPLELLNKVDRLSDEEMAQIKLHPVHGRTILHEHVAVPEVVLEIAHSHHERVDGSGYPRGLKGGSISREAMIVSVVDVYDAITSDRVYHTGISPHEALNLMYSWAPASFPCELLEEFIKCLGIFPVGSIVELDSGEVGVVMTLNRRHHLHPIVVLVLDAHKQPYKQRKMINLELMREHGSVVNIKKILQSKAYGIDVRHLMVNSSEPAANELAV